MKVVKDDSNADYFHQYRSRSYDVRIDHDTLIIEIQSNDQLKNSADPRDNRNYVDIYYLPTKDIASIDFVQKQGTLYDHQWKDAYIEILALRDYPLFTHIYKGLPQKTDGVKIRVVNFSDTTQFQLLADVLNAVIQPEKNFMPPSCEVDEIKLKNQSFQAIESANLQEPVYVNAKVDINKTLQKVLMPYLEKENIKKFFGDVIIDQNGAFVYLISEQNNQYNYLNSLDSIPPSFRVLQKIAFHYITDTQVEEISEILAKQNWTAGKCNDQAVQSYFDFYVENSNYKE